MSLFACPKCQHPESRVIDTREREEGSVLRRRRECLEPTCRHRWNTEEKTLENARCSIHDRPEK